MPKTIPGGRSRPEPNDREGEAPAEPKGARNDRAGEAGLEPNDREGEAPAEPKGARNDREGEAPAEPRAASGALSEDPTTATRTTTQPPVSPIVSSAHPPPVGLRVALLATLTAVLWGGNPVAVSYSVDSIPPITVAALRFALATVCMLFWCRWEGCGLWLTSGQWVPVTLAGIGLFVQISLFNIGVLLSNSSHGAMLIPTYVFWVNLLEHYVTKSDRLSCRKVLGLSLATAGVVLILSVTGRPPESKAVADDANLWGDLVLLCSALVLAVKVIYIKHAVKIVPPGRLILWHDLVGVLLFCGCSFLFEEPNLATTTAAAWLGLAYQGVFVAGLCFAIQARLLQHHSASQIAIYSFVTPLAGVLFAVVFRADRLSPWLIVSTICVTVGIWVIHWRNA